jgi:hypothetical protein
VKYERCEKRQKKKKDKYDDDVVMKKVGGAKPYEKSPKPDAK